MNRPTKSIAGHRADPVEVRRHDAVLGAGRATCRSASCAPRLAARNARLVIQTGTDRPEVRKSSLVEIFACEPNQCPAQRTKYRARMV